MANLGLLMDPHTSLNILPDKHKKEFQYFRPNQILQNAVLGLIMVFSLGAYNQRSKIADLEKHLPAKYKKEIDTVVLSSTLATNAVVNGFGDTINLILIGYENNVLENNNLKKVAKGDFINFINGGHDAQGNEIPLKQN